MLDTNIHLLPALPGAAPMLDLDVDDFFCSDCRLMLDSDGECRGNQCWCADCETAYTFTFGERECECTIAASKKAYWESNMEYWAKAD